MRSSASAAALAVFVAATTALLPAAHALKIMFPQFLPLVRVTDAACGAALTADIACTVDVSHPDPASLVSSDVDPTTFCPGGRTPANTCSTAYLDWVANVRAHCDDSKVAALGTVAGVVAPVLAGTRTACLRAPGGEYCAAELQNIFLTNDDNDQQLPSNSDGEGVNENLQGGSLDGVGRGPYYQVPTDGSACTPCQVSYWYTMSLNSADSAAATIYNYLAFTCGYDKVTAWVTGTAAVCGPRASTLTATTAQATCPSGQCCNAMGQCGTSTTDCGDPSIPGTGCIFGYGVCNRQIDQQATCGARSPVLQQCGPDACCSHDGQCGTGAAFCSSSDPYGPLTANGLIDGCQSGFGHCDPYVPFNQTIAECGPLSPTLASCRAGSCCSASGTCGTTTEFCTGACQAGFGECGRPWDPTAACGITSQNSTSCPLTQCCSANGRCAADEASCNSNDCQSGFGNCGWPLGSTCPLLTGQFGTDPILPATPVGQTATGVCPSGLNGTATAPCQAGGIWGAPDLHECVYLNSTAFPGGPPPPGPSGNDVNVLSSAGGRNTLTAAAPLISVDKLWALSIQNDGSLAIVGWGRIAYTIATKVEGNQLTLSPNGILLQGTGTPFGTWAVNPRAGVAPYSVQFDPSGCLINTDSAKTVIWRRCMRVGGVLSTADARPNLDDGDRLVSKDGTWAFVQEGGTVFVEQNAQSVYYLSREPDFTKPAQRVFTLRAETSGRLALRHTPMDEVSWATDNSNVQAAPVYVLTLSVPVLGRFCLTLATPSNDRTAWLQCIQSAFQSDNNALSTLTEGMLYSPDGIMALSLSRSGAVNVERAGQTLVVLAKADPANSPNRLLMQNDGDLVRYSKSNQPTYATGPWTAEREPVKMVRISTTAIWLYNVKYDFVYWTQQFPMQLASDSANNLPNTLQQNQMLYAPAAGINIGTSVQLDPMGMLAQYDSLFFIGSLSVAQQGMGVVTLVLNTNGNLEVRNAGNAVMWQSNTGGKGQAPYRLSVDAVRGMMITDSTGAVTYEKSAARGAASIRGRPAAASIVHATSINNQTAVRRPAAAAEVHGIITNIRTAVRLPAPDVALE
ncbi:hypothetical protein BDZ88DRAFT_433111 [Geranomyces variabilis]|nr:hypothetical protein BDZ88DRAFT_433111 [Geranomyces variabilis]KAJ3134396.1 hypothetical protein HDU90_005009 [Geranomyces variabilis]